MAATHPRHVSLFDTIRFFAENYTLVADNCAQYRNSLVFQAFP